MASRPRAFRRAEARRDRAPWLAVALALAAAGCGGPEELDLPPLAEVSGTVTLDNEPLAGAAVTFVPDKSKGTTGPPAVGFTDDKGRYTLKTAGKTGAVVGFHKVSVEARQKPKNEQDTLPPLLTPPRYTNPDASGLAAEVKADQANVVPLPLSRKP